jgi:hypothetical protein
MKTKQMSWILLIVLVLSLVAVNRAQAKEIVKVTIAGPGLKGEVELTNVENLKIIDELGFADKIYQPTSMGTESHFEIRTAVGDGTEVVAIGIYHYYPASKQHPSYIYYPGSINAWSSRDKQYFLVPEDTDQKLRGLLTNLGAALPDTTNESTSPFILPSSLLWFILGSVLCLMIGIAMKMRLAATAR